MPAKGHFSSIKKHNQSTRYIQNKYLDKYLDMFQMKQQEKSPKEGISEMEISNIVEKEVRVVLVKTIKNLRRRMHTQSKKILI